VGGQERALLVDLGGGVLQGGQPAVDAGRRQLALFAQVFQKAFGQRARPVVGVVGAGDGVLFLRECRRVVTGSGSPLRRAAWECFFGPSGGVYTLFHAQFYAFADPHPGENAAVMPVSMK